jgi:hypothetical protein
MVFGAAACLHVDARFAAAVLDAWEHGRSSLRVPGADRDRAAKIA